MNHEYCCTISYLMEGESWEAASHTGRDHQTTKVVVCQHENKNGEQLNDF